MTEGLGKKVVGIAYDPAKGLPRIVLKGTGNLAELIEQQFEESRDAHRIVEDAVLLEKLFRLPTDSEISPDLYELVAILLTHIFAVDAKLKEMK